MTSIWAAVLVLGLLIFVHELGHFLAARLFGVTVTRFSLGFGPKLVGFTRGETEYRISAVPLGGYVKMLGENPDEEEAAVSQPGAFVNKSIARRLMIVAAGPVSNFVLGVVVFALILYLWGVPVLMPQVGKLLDGYPAAGSGLREGDLVVEVNGRPVRTWDEMAELIKNNGLRPLQLTVERDGKLHSVSVTPAEGESKDIFGQPIKKPMVGISPSGRAFIRKLDFFPALWGGVVQAWDVTRLTFVSLAKVITRQIPMSSVGGPIFIVEAAGRQAKEGLVNLLFFMGLISVNLGLLNILPIPVLDGGHLFFFLIEAVIRRPVSVKIRERAMQAGVIFLVAFMAVIFYNDILRIITRSTGAG